eukprot:6459174-Amphidinium_carterae.1
MFQSARRRWGFWNQFCSLLAYGTKTDATRDRFPTRASHLVTLSQESEDCQALQNQFLFWSSFRSVAQARQWLTRPEIANERVCMICEVQ